MAKAKLKKDAALHLRIVQLEAENEGLERQVAELKGVREGARADAGEWQARCGYLADRIVTFQRKLLIIREVVSLPSGER